MQLLAGSTVAKEWIQNITPTLKDKGLGIVLIGDDPASHVYVKLKAKKANEVGVFTNIQYLPQTATVNEVIAVIQAYNTNESITGILVQLPLPDHLSEYTRVILDSISYSKDVDVLSSQRLSQILTHKESLLPATPAGVIKLLNHYEISVIGKHSVIVGASLLVGTPLAIRLEQLGATVTLCNKYTSELREITRLGDIVICAVGKPGLITDDHIKVGAIVIDVGTTKVGDNMVGDVEFKTVSQKADYITPNPHC
jgi:methylenetetrahydrofolate dehydrogenase (NADP+) / methenyltetrahydrofolate cyclohydrolase